MQSTKACSHCSFDYGVRGVSLSLWLAEIYGNLCYVSRLLGLANAGGTLGRKMIERVKIQPYRQWRDPAQLTPYEARIWGYLQQGMSIREVAEALGGERSVESVRSTVRVVKDKLGAAYFDE